MPLPYTFISGDIARSAEVNANFQYIMDILGHLSTPETVQGLGQYVLGPRKLAYLSASQDLGPDANAFLQISWNTTWSNVSGSWKFGRILVSTPASALRIGLKGAEFLTTSATSGDLNAQLTKIWGLRATTGEDFMYLKDDVHVQNVDTPATTIQGYRLTTVFLETPIKIYDGPVGQGSTVINVNTLGIPVHAKGVKIYAHVTAGASSGAGMHFYQKRSNAVTDLDRARGFVVHGYSANTASGRSGGQGDVPTGQVAHQGQIVIERTASFALAKVYIMGYLT